MLKNIKQCFNNILINSLSKQLINKILNKKINSIAAGNSYFKKCNKFIEDNLKAKKCIITNSCTTALEICAMLINIKKGDEVIMPSYTFTSSANAFVIRGAKPVFVDIKKETLNIHENLIEKEITKKTKAILVVHYAGVPCEMKKIIEIAKKHKLIVIEDAAQAIFSKYKNKYCGTLGDLGCFSFHETKNISCGEGGALIINKKKYLKKASIIINKGTDRENYLKDKKKFYSWVGPGSSSIPSEITCAFLYGQLINFKRLNYQRKILWNNYKKNLVSLSNKNIKLPEINKNIKHNNHIFYLIFKSKKIRDLIMKKLNKVGIMAVFHYIPLHISNFGKKFYKKKLPNTEIISSRILRLPLWIGMNQKLIISRLKSIINSSI
jgi:dTDP-4-amino-4,6-dideoxygalactose transaminase